MKFICEFFFLLDLLFFLDQNWYNNRWRRSKLKENIVTDESNLSSGISKRDVRSEIVTDLGRLWKAHNQRTIDGQQPPKKEIELMMNGLQENKLMMNGLQENKPMVNGLQENKPMMNGQLENKPMMNGELENKLMMNGQLENKPMMNGQLEDKPMMNGQLENKLMMNGQLVINLMMHGHQENKLMANGQQENKLMMSGYQENKLMMNDQQNNELMMNNEYELDDEDRNGDDPFGSQWTGSDGSTFPADDTFNWNRQAGEVRRLSPDDVR